MKYILYHTIIFVVKYIFIWYIFGLLNMDNLFIKFIQSLWCLTFCENLCTHYYVTRWREYICIGALLGRYFLAENDVIKIVSWQLLCFIHALAHRKDTLLSFCICRNLSFHPIGNSYFLILELSHLFFLTALSLRTQLRSSLLGTRT